MECWPKYWPGIQGTYITTYAFIGLPSREFHQLWPSNHFTIHIYFGCEPPHVPAVVAAQLGERLLRGYLLFGYNAVRVVTKYTLKETSEPEHPFLIVDNSLLDAEPRTFSLQPETEGTAQLSGEDTIGARYVPIDGIAGNPQASIERFVASYKHVSSRTRRLVELYIRGALLRDFILFRDDAFLNFYKIYESFRQLLRKRFPAEDCRLRRIESDAGRPRERANVIARLVALPIGHDADFQNALDQIELTRDKIVAHWNFAEDDDNWWPPFHSLAMIMSLAHRIVLWEVENDPGRKITNGLGQNGAES
jgi:hypothetical protein